MWCSPKTYEIHIEEIQGSYTFQWKYKITLFMKFKIKGVDKATFIIFSC